MKPVEVLLLFTVGSVCGRVAAERKLAYVTVVSNVSYKATEAMLTPDFHLIFR